MTLAAWVVGALISNLLVASVLGLVAWRVSRRGRHPALAHALWVLVLVKLVTPPVVDLPVLPQGMDPAALVGALEEGWHSRALNGEPAGAAVTEPVLLAEATSAGAPHAKATLSPVVVFVGALAGAWALGALVSLVRTCSQRRRLGALFAQAAAPPESTRRRAQELAGRLGLTSAPPVRVVGASISPLLWSGAGRARIVLPAELLDDLPSSQLDALLLHELAHYARRDHWVRLAELAVGALYWWFPPVTWVRRQLREVEEQCCDAWVVAARPEGARDYAEALLGTLAFLERGRSDPLSPVATAAVTTNELTRRLTMIMDRHGAPRLSPGARLAALVLAVVVLPAGPTVIADEAVQDPASPAVQDVTAFTQPPAPAAEPVQIADAPADDDERAAKKAAKQAAKKQEKEEKKAARAAKKAGKRDASAKAGSAKKGRAAVDVKVAKKAKAAGDAKAGKKAKGAAETKAAKSAKAKAAAKGKSKGKADAREAKKAKGAGDAKAAKKAKGAGDAKAAKKAKGAAMAKAAKKVDGAAEAKASKTGKAAKKAKASAAAKGAAKAKAAKQAKSAADAKASKKGKAAKKAKAGADAKGARKKNDKKNEAKDAKRKADAKAGKTKAKEKAAKKEAAAEARAAKKAATKAERAAKKADRRAKDEPVDAMLQDA
jgi:beta-lactamase regulating signal transducer with metallopeptidase domain